MVYVLAVGHTLAYRSDTKLQDLVWFVVWAMQIPIISAFATRLPIRPRRYLSCYEQKLELKSGEPHSAQPTRVEQ